MSSTPRIYFERILCTTDLTSDSDEALRYAIALARAYGSKLIVCHSTEGAAPIAGQEYDHTVRSIEAAVGRYLKPCHTEQLKHEVVVVAGDPAVTINREAAKERAELIVMRSRRRPYAAALLGSTAESLCRTAPCPVLVTHRNEREWAGVSTNQIDLKRVLAAVDFSTGSELALTYALSLAEEFQAELHLLHVLDSHSRPEVPELALLPVAADDSFQAAARRLRESVPAEAHLWCKVKQAVSSGPPYREILAYADEQNIDLICIGAHGEGFGMRALFGSNVDRVLRQSPCPVLIARPLKPASLKEAPAGDFETPDSEGRPEGHPIVEARAS
jgi:nucleotide-binding universal stress UspA family protein